MRANAIKHTKDVLIKYLRLYLNNYDNYKDFCDRDFAKDEIVVWDKDPNDARKLPAVIITSGTGQLITSGLQDFAQEIYDERTGELISYRYGGIYELSLQVDIGARSTRDREILSDLITLAYRVQLRRAMQNEGILVKDMRYGNESDAPYDSDRIYVSSIQISTWSEWYQDVDLLTIQDVTINEN